MPPVSQPVKQQHYLPEKALLQYFTGDSGKLHAYRFSGSAHEFHKGSHYQATPHNLAREGYIYETPGLPTNALERVLATIETAHQDVMDTKILQSLPLTAVEESNVKLFIDMQHSRVPSYRDHMQSFTDRMEKIGRQMALVHNNPQAAEDWTTQIDDVRERIFAMNLTTRLEIQPMRHSDLAILEIRESFRNEFYFVLGDNPVTFRDFTDANSFYGMHPLNKTIEIIAPISQHHAVFINNVGVTGYHDADAFDVDEINQRSIVHSRDLILARDEVDDRYYDRIMPGKHQPISFVLKFIKKPRGNKDRALEWIKKQEKRDRRI